MEDILTLVGWLVVIGYFAQIYLAGVVAEDKGFAVFVPMMLAFITGPFVWLYLIARPVTPKRAAQHQLNVADWVAEITREEAEAKSSLTD